jgi:Beta-propeller repeat
MSKARLRLLGLGFPIVGAILYLVVVVPALHRSSKPVRLAGGTPQATAHPRLRVEGNLPLSFEINRGQTDGPIDFLSRGRGYTLFLGATEAVFSLARPNNDDAGVQTPRSPVGKLRTIRADSASTVLRMQLTGSNPHAVKRGLQQLPGKVNYFLGNDPSKWRTNVATYAKVEYDNVYPGVNLRYYGNERELEYDFVVAPGADPKAIRLTFEGASKLKVDAKGNLLLDTASGQELQLQKPFIYQDTDDGQEEITGGFVLANGHVSFQLAAYDANRPVVIDPTFVYSTHLGGARSSSGQGIAVDPAGNVYVTGDTNSEDFPIVKPFQHGQAGSPDVFITKLSPDGSKMLYSTYVGGSGDDVGYGIAVDSAGNAYITGDTSSANFPLEKPLQKSAGGVFDAFVLKLSSDGSKLLYSTFMGGSQGDRGDAIAVDASGSAYVAGYTYSTDFPVLNPIQTAFSDGNVHCFVTKLNPAGSALVYSTYLGGGDDRPDQATGIAVDSVGNAYVTGYTNSAKFPSVNSIQKFVGPTDVFVTKINAAGSAFAYSTHIGGNADDEGMAIAVDASGSAYVTGETESVDFPTTPGAYSTKCFSVPTPGRMREICAGGDVFVSKLSPDGSKLVYSTYVNGTGFEAGRGIAVDAAGSAYVVGLTTSLDFPLVSPLQKGFGGGNFDAFIFKLSPDGSALVYSSTLGGDQNDGGYGIAVDGKGNAYVTGYTYSTDFPTKNPLKKGSGTANPGYRDVFVSKIADAGGSR